MPDDQIWMLATGKCPMTIYSLMSIKRTGQHGCLYIKEAAEFCYLRF